MVGYIGDTLDILIHVETYLHRCFVEEEIKTENENELSCLKFNLYDYKELNWTKQGKEFEYGGELYDVKSIKQQGNTVKIEAKNDSKEKHLKNLYKSLSKNRQSNEKLKGSKTYIYSNKSLKIYDVVSILPFLYYELKSQERPLSIDIPPPKFFL